MVLGAGRGPLVNASLRAAKQAERKIKVYAVEKNPNAVITWVWETESYRLLTSWHPPITFSDVLFCRLEGWRYEEWGSQVTVVSNDMREWNPPEKADIIVSELLGSFGDNELSPECLDGAQHFLKGFFDFHFCLGPVHFYPSMAGSKINGNAPQYTLMSSHTF